MYFIQYSQGRVVCDGYGQTVESILALIPGKPELLSVQGDRQKWGDTSGDPLLSVVYIAPEKWGDRFNE